MTTSTFNFTGSRFAFVVPDQCSSITVDVRGAGGGGAGNTAAGGRVVATYTVAPGDVIYGRVGGAGQSHSGNNGGAGGYNGGGAGGDSSGAGGSPGTGGGGASDLRLNADTLVAQFAIGGGGGGLSGDGGNNGGSGGAATGENGSSGTGIAGSGGSQVAGGAAGASGDGLANNATAGARGGSTAGGNGSFHSTANARSGGGGGGGYYGGGGGGGAVGSHTAGGGGGGSNFVGAGTVTTNTRDGGGAPRANGSITITYNMPPSQPAGTSQSAYNHADPMPVTFTYTDPDPGDAMSSADVQWRVGSGAWNSIPSATTTTSYSFAANLFDAYIDQTIEWQVRTYDSHGAVSPWSASDYFQAQVAPNPPTPLGPMLFNSNTPTVGWTSYPTSESCYQIQVGTDVAGAFGAVLLDTGAVVFHVGIGGLVYQYITNLPYVPYVDHVFYHVRVRYQHFGGVSGSGGVWSDWWDSGAIEAVVSAPLAPTVVLTPLNNTASIKIDVTNPGSDPHPPTSNKIYRTNLDDGSDEQLLATSVAVNGSFIDPTPASRCTYRYRVEAANAIASTSSA